MDIRSIGQDMAPVALVEQPVSPREVAERRQLVQAVRVINEVQAFGQNNELTYAVDRQSRRTVLRIVNRETREVVRQIPSEDVLQLAQSLSSE